MMSAFGRNAIVLFWVTVCVSIPAFAEAGASSPAPDFAVGQEWSIKSSSPTTAKVVVGRVVKWRDRVCVHVSVIDIRIPNPLPGAGSTTNIEDIPFDEAALSSSVDRLLAVHVSPSPNFEDGYKQWHDANGGVFSMSVEKAIQAMFQAISRRQG